MLDLTDYTDRSLPEPGDSCSPGRCMMKLPVSVIRLTISPDQN